MVGRCRLSADEVSIKLPVLGAKRRRHNDGSAPIESVLVSFDRRQSWRPAKFEVPDSPYAWYQWTTQGILKPGTHEIWARATDALGRSQPLDGTIFWNPNGYEWTGVFKCEVTVS